MGSVWTKLPSAAEAALAASCMVLLFASEAETAAGDTSYWCFGVGEDKCAPGGFATNGSAVDSSAMDGSAVDSSAVDGSAVDSSAMDGSAVDSSGVDGFAIDSSAVNGLEPSAAEGAFASAIATARSATGASATAVLSCYASASDVSAAVSAVEERPAAEGCAVLPSEVESAVAELAEASTAGRFCCPVASTATSMTTEPVELCCAGEMTGSCAVMTLRCLLAADTLDNS